MSRPLNEQIAACRLAAGLSQPALARAIGTGQSAVARLESHESGGHSVLVRTLERIAEATDATLEIRLIPKGGK